MSEAGTFISQCYVKIDGALVPDEFMASLFEITVDNSLHMPDVATIALNDPSLKWIDSALLAPGKPLEISGMATPERAKARSVFDGEIVELEPEFGANTHRLTVRAYDRLHRLARGRRVRSFQNVTDSDIATRMAGEAGLQAEVEATREVHAYLFQDNETNLEFLRRRATAVGYLFYVHGKKLCFKRLTHAGSPIELSWGASLGEFRPRMTTVSQVNQVTVRGWDPKSRQEIVSDADGGNGVRDIGEKRPGGVVAKEAFRLDARLLVADTPIRSQAAADRLAAAVADRQAERFIEADGACGGDPAIVAGATVRVSSIGTRFGGTYFVTAATHRFTPRGGYSTEFSISGQTPSTLLELLQRGRAPASRFGLVVGIVTDNQDPEGWGRVKVKYPWLSGDHASDWARVVAVGGGPQRGVEFLPEIDDEVLVGFEMGDVHYPYVLGGLWNGSDQPPKKTSQVVSGGRVQQRIIRSRTGHTIVLDDNDGSSSIAIADKNGNTLLFDTSRNALTIDIKGDVSVNAKGSLTLDAAGQIGISAGGPVNIKGAAVNVKGGTINLN